MNENKKEDIFDKLIQLPILNIFEPFYKKNKEILLYLFFGGFAFFLNIILFTLLCFQLRIDELISNAICWFICVLFQFFTNRTWVFQGYVKAVNTFLQQIVMFFAGRVLTLVTEEIIIAVFITWLKYNTIIVKLSAQIIVVFGNYIISKFFVFKNKN